MLSPEAWDLHNLPLTSAFALTCPTLIFVRTFSSHQPDHSIVYTRYATSTLKESSGTDAFNFQIFLIMFQLGVEEDSFSNLLVTGHLCWGGRNLWLEKIRMMKLVRTYIRRVERFMGRDQYILSLSKGVGSHFGLRGVCPTLQYIIF